MHFRYPSYNTYIRRWPQQSFNTLMAADIRLLTSSVGCGRQLYILISIWHQDLALLTATAQVYNKKVDIFWNYNCALGLVFTLTLTLHNEGPHGKFVLRVKEKKYHSQILTCRWGLVIHKRNNFSNVPSDKVNFWILMWKRKYFSFVKRFCSR